MSADRRASALAAKVSEVLGAARRASTGTAARAWAAALLAPAERPLEPAAIRH